MAKRYSGDLQINLIYNDRNFYRASVSLNGRVLWKGNVRPAPAGFGPGIAYDSPKAFDEIASSALAFAEDEVGGIGDHADYAENLTGYLVHRTPPAKKTSHATKKSPTQLDHEIATALARKGKQRHDIIAEESKIRDAITRFPPTFGLRGFPGDVFRLSPTSSYISSGDLMLYTQRKEGDHWLDFSKGTESELRGEVVTLPPAGPSGNGRAPRRSHATRAKSDVELDRDIARALEETQAKDYRIVVRDKSTSKPVYTSLWMTKRQAEETANNRKSLIKDRGWSMRIEIETRHCAIVDRVRLPDIVPPPADSRTPREHAARNHATIGKSYRVSALVGGGSSLPVNLGTVPKKSSAMKIANDFMKKTPPKTEYDSVQILPLVRGQRDWNTESMRWLGVTTNVRRPMWVRGQGVK